MTPGIQTERSFERGLASASAILVAAAVVGKPISFLRDVAIAREFGATSVVDYVILAQLLPLASVSVVSAGLTLALPHIFRSAITGFGDAGLGLGRALSFTRRILSAEAALLLSGGLILTLLLVPIRPAGAPAPLLLVGLLGLQALLESAVEMFGQLRQLRGDFKSYAFQYAANGLVTIAVVVSLGDTMGVLAWPLGMILDASWQVIFLRVGLKQSRTDTRTAMSVRQSVRMAAWPVAMQSGLLAYVVADRVAGLIAGAGVLAVWTWALKLQQAVNGAVALPFSQVLFSRGHLTGRREPHLYGLVWIAATALATVAAVMFVFLGGPVIEFLFSSSTIGPTDLERLERLALLALLAGIPAAMFTASSRALFSKGQFRDAVVSVAAGATVYAFSLLVLIGALGYMALGVSFVIASSVTGVLCTMLARRRGLIRLRAAVSIVWRLRRCWKARDSGPPKA